MLMEVDEVTKQESIVIGQRASKKMKINKRTQGQQNCFKAAALFNSLPVQQHVRTSSSGQYSPCHRGLKYHRKFCGIS